MIFECLFSSSTFCRPAMRASADFPVPARPPIDTIPRASSSSMSMAIRCSADRPWTPKMSRSPRTIETRLPVRTRPSPDPRGEVMTTPVLTTSSETSSVTIDPES